MVLDVKRRMKIDQSLDRDESKKVNLFWVKPLPKTMYSM